MIDASRPVLVTGGAGFIGCNLADRLASEGCRVRVFDALARPGVRDNLDWLTARHGTRIEPIIADVRDGDAVAAAARGVGAIYHLAAQVAVTSSLEAARHDFEVNALGTFNVLEAARRENGAPVIFASTNKVYGDLADAHCLLTEAGYRPASTRMAQDGVGEAQPLDFHTPYGCSKGAADQYVLDYARSFGVPTAVLRMSCIYGPRQKGTEDQGWVAHFVLRALRGEPITIYGDGQQVRDVLDVSDVVEAYLGAWRNIARISGRAFNIGGGPDNAVSLAMVIARIGEILGRPVPAHHAEWRQGDQRWFVADTRAAQAILGFRARTGWREGLARLTASLAEDLNLAEDICRPREPALDAAGERAAL